MARRSESAAQRKRRQDRVMVVFHHFPPYPGAGSIRALYIMRALAAIRGQTDITLLTTVTERAVADAETGYEVVAIGSDPVDNRRSLPSRALGEIVLGLRAGLRIILERPALAIISSPGFLLAAIAVTAARLARTPYVLDVRDLYPEVYSAAGVLEARSFAFGVLQRLSDNMYRRATLITAATQGLVRHISSRAPGQDVKIIYNGCPEALLSQIAVKKERFTCVFHGILGFYQDAESLLALAQSLAEHDIEVVVIGYGRGEDVLTNATQPNLSFLGKLPFMETMEIVASCHVGLCLRRDDAISRDAFPVKVFEYLGLGLPMIITPPSEAGDFIIENGCGEVMAAGDIQSMTTAVLHLRADTTLYSERVAACRRAAAEFTREEQSARFANLVQTALVLPEADQ